MPTAEELEFLKLYQSRKHLLNFIRHTFPRYDAAKHHKLICRKLEALATRKIKRLMIFAPPRHGKSEICSIRFPAWYMGLHPEHQIITSSYAAQLAGDFGRKVRNLIQTDEYRQLFPNVELATDSQAANRWHTNHGGSFLAVGVQGGATGHGADLFLIDDPVKDAEEADSELVRDKVWDWYKTVATTRLMPNAAICVIQTRWHEDDLSGRLLDVMEKDGEQWTIISLPAICDSDDDAVGRKIGEALWPNRYPLSRLEEVRTVLTSGSGNRFWSALYQQKPTPDEGDFFHKDWIKYYDERPAIENLTIYATSDYAVTEKGGDYTVHTIFGVDPNADIYILDVYREQAGTEEWVNAQIAMMNEWRPFEWVGEAGQIEKSVGPFLRQRMTETNTYCNITALPSIGSKTQRAQSIRGRTSMGKVYFPRHAHWVDDAVSEMLHFPAGKHDDFVDTLSLLGRILDETWSPYGGTVERANTDPQLGSNVLKLARDGNLEALAM